MSDLVNRFTYHPPKEGQPALYESLRKHGLELALAMSASQPAGRELALALTKLEEAVMWCNAGIARNT